MSQYDATHSKLYTEVPIPAHAVVHIGTSMVLRGDADVHVFRIYSYSSPGGPQEITRHTDAAKALATLMRYRLLGYAIPVDGLRCVRHFAKVAQ